MPDLALLVNWVQLIHTFNANFMTRWPAELQYMYPLQIGVAPWACRGDVILGKWFIAKGALLFFKAVATPRTLFLLEGWRLFAKFPCVYNQLHWCDAYDCTVDEIGQLKCGSHCFSGVSMSILWHPLDTHVCQQPSQKDFEKKKIFSEE